MLAQQVVQVDLGGFLLPWQPPMLCGLRYPSMPPQYFFWGSTWETAVTAGNRQHWKLYLLRVCDSMATPAMELTPEAGPLSPRDRVSHTLVSHDVAAPLPGCRPRCFPILTPPDYRQASQCCFGP